VTRADAFKMNRPQEQEKTEENREKRGASMMLTLKQQSNDISVSKIVHMRQSPHRFQRMCAQQD
jgi:hypothetical protein